MRGWLRLALATLLVLFLGTLPAGAIPLDATVRETLGNGGYQGTKASIDVGDDLHIRTSYSQYSSDVSSGTTRTYSLSLGYDADRFGVELSGGSTPRIGGYSSHYFGGEGRVTFWPGLEKKNWSLDLGLGATRTTHRDELSLTAGASGRRERVIVSKRPSAFVLEQTDAIIFGSARLGRHRLSLDLTRSFYDKDLSLAQARASRVTALSGVMGSIEGFPRTSAAVKWRMKDVKFAQPYLSLSRTTFEVAQPAAHSFGAGALIKIGEASLDVGYEHNWQPEASDRRYYSLSITWSWD